MMGENTIQSETRPIADLLYGLEHFQTRVIWNRSYFAEYGSNFDVFYSFCRVDNGYISLHGEMPIETFHERRKENSKIARLYKCEYEMSRGGLVQTRKKYIGLGADPRMVSDGANAYAYVIGYGEAGHPAFLYSARDDVLRPLQAPADFNWGKNWQPYMRDGRLFVVHELSPFSIHEIDPETATLTPFHSSDADFDLPAHNTNHTMFRGGANAMADGDFIYGIGRASAQSYRHAPFLWSSRSLKPPVIQFSNFFNVLNGKGFNIVDPTSFFKAGNNYYIGLACSETCWFHKQRILNMLIVLDADNLHSEAPAWKSFLDPFPDQFKGRKVNLRSHLLHCDRMQHAIPFVREYGVQSVGIPGALVYGPYIEMEEALILKVELAYLTLQDGGERAGTFDINLSRENAGGDVEFARVAACVLPPTNKDISYATLYFDTRAYVGFKAEFRVFADEGFELNAFHIKIEEATHPIPSNGHGSIPTTLYKEENSVPARIANAGRVRKLLSLLREAFKILFARGS